jgi:hypothetical protein
MLDGTSADALSIAWPDNLTGWGLLSRLDRSCSSNGADGRRVMVVVVDILAI